MITRENYEIYIVDYLDGTLSVEDRTMVDSFLDSNPDIKELVADMMDTFLEPKKDSYPNKDTLKVTPELPVVNLTNFHDFLSKIIEGEALEQDLAALQSFLSNHDAIKPYADVNELIRLESSNLIFDSKDVLYKFSSERPFALLAIMHADGDIEIGDRREFEYLIENSANARALYDVLTTPTLVAPQLSYAYKSDLKKSGRVIPLWVQRSAAIAAVLAIGLFTFNQFDSSNSERTYNARSQSNGLADFVIPESTDSEDEMFNPVTPNNSVSDDTVTTPSSSKPSLPITPYTPPSPENEIALELKDTSDSSEPQENTAFEKLDSVVNAMNLPNEENITEYQDSIPTEIQDDVAAEIQKVIQSENTTNDLTALAVDGLGKVLKTDSGFEQRESIERKTTRFSLGKFGYYRSSKK